MIHARAAPAGRSARASPTSIFVGETTDVPAIQMDAAALSALQAAEHLAPC